MIKAVLLSPISGDGRAAFFIFLIKCVSRIYLYYFYFCIYIDYEPDVSYN